jgi:hypothetical protein
MLGPPGAGLIIYLATIFTWLGLAAYGFNWKINFAWWRYPYDGWDALTAYGAVLAVAWVLLARWLRKSATGGLPKKWKRRRVELPPIEPTYECDDYLSAAKKRAAKLIDANKNDKEPAAKQALAELDQAEKEYLLRLHQALLLCRIPAAMPNRQRVNGTGYGIRAWFSDGVLVW